MLDKLETQNKTMTLGLLGASFHTGNLGVSALAESSVKLLLNRRPDCEIVFACSGYEPKTENVAIGQEYKEIVNIPIRFSKNIFHDCHLLKFLFYGLLIKIGFKGAGNEYFKTLNSCDLVCDITGGDSFSDIYGFKRFFLGFLTKWLFLFLGKDLVMLPQTYGPFKKKISQKMAAYVLKKAKVIYSRDEDGVKCARRMLKGGGADKVKLCPDVAFVLDTEIWNDKSVADVAIASSKGSQIVGLNVSGLLYNGGYTQNNMFGLALDYKELIKQIIDFFLAIDGVTIVLVPHVFPKDNLAVESDPVACKSIYDSLTEKQKENVILPEKEPNQRQVKYLIGKCDFFLGSRMHSCIAALSQCVPTVGMAYSGKFAGVFETIGVSDCVADMRCTGNVELLDKVIAIYQDKINVRNNLEATIPETKQKILSLLDDVKI